MPNFAANLTMLYNEVDFLDRFAAAATDRFAGVEFLFPYAYPKDELAARRTGWSPPAPKHTRGVLAKYAKLVGSAAQGAVCD